MRYTTERCITFMYALEWIFNDCSFVFVNESLIGWNDIVVCIYRASVQLAQRLDILCKSTVHWNELFQSETLGIRQRYMYDSISLYKYLVMLYMFYILNDFNYMFNIFMFNNIVWRNWIEYILNYDNPVMMYMCIFFADHSHCHRT